MGLKDCLSKIKGFSALEKISLTTAASSVGEMQAVQDALDLAVAERDEILAIILKARPDLVKNDVAETPPVKSQEPKTAPVKAEELVVEKKKRGRGRPPKTEAEKQAETEKPSPYKDAADIDADIDKFLRLVKKYVNNPSDTIRELVEELHEKLTTHTAEFERGETYEEAYADFKAATKKNKTTTKKAETPSVSKFDEEAEEDPDWGINQVKVADNVDRLEKPFGNEGLTKLVKSLNTKSFDVKSFVQALTNLQNTNPLIKALTTTINRLLLDGQKITFDAKLALNDRGEYRSGDGSIVLNPDLLDHPVEFVYVLAHELVHARTSTLVSAITRGEKVPANVKTAFDNLEKLYNDSLNNKVREYYGLENLHEFIAEAMSNPYFMDYLNGKSAPQGLSKIASIWNKFVSAIFDLLGLNKNSALHEVYQNADILIAATAHNDMVFDKRPSESLYNKGSTPSDSGMSEAMLNRWRTQAKPQTKADIASALKTGAEFGGGAWSKVKELGIMGLTINQLADQLSKYTDIGKKYYTVLAQQSGDSLRRMEANSKLIAPLLDLKRQNPAMYDKVEDLLIRLRLDEIDIYALKGKDQTKLTKDEREALKEFNSLNSQAKSTLKSIHDFYNSVYNEINEINEQNYEATLRAGYNGRAGLSEAEIDKRVKQEVYSARLAIKKKLEQKKAKGNYFPLYRTGSHWVSVYFKGANGAVDFSSDAFESRAEAEKFFKFAKGQPNVSEVKIFTANPKLNTEQAPSTKFITDVVQLLRKGNATEDVIQKVYNAFLDAQPESSLRKAFMKAEGVQGFNRNALQVLAETSSNYARYLPKLKFRTQLNQLIESLDQFAKDKLNSVEDRVPAFLVNQLIKLHNENAKGGLAPGKITQFLSSLGYNWYLGLSPASAMINMLQTPMVSYPYMAARYGGYSRVGSIMLASIAELRKGKTSARDGFYSFEQALQPDKNDSAEEAKRKARELEAFMYFKQHNQISFTEFEDLSNAKNISSTTGNTLHKINFIMGYQFHHAERFNREVSAMTAYRAAFMQTGSDAKAKEAAVNTISETHGDYSAENQSMLFKKPASKLILMFRKYTQNMLYLQFRMMQKLFDSELSKEERTIAAKQILGTYAATAAMAGAAGLPFWNFLAALANFFFRNYGEDGAYFDAKTALRNYAGPMSEAAVSGLPTLLGVNVSQRMSSDILDTIGLTRFRSPSKDDSVRATAVEGVVASLGPLMGIAMGGAQSIDYMMEGQYERALETSSPIFARNILKASRFAMEGALTLDGMPLVDDLGVDEILMQLGGVSPAKLARQYEVNSALRSAENRVKRMHASILTMVNDARMNGDDELLAEAYEAMSKFNMDYPEVAVTEKNIQQSFKQKQRALEQVLNGLRMNPKSRPRALEAVNMNED